ncbi:MAG: SCP2 sterol-binding domain-containing protein [Anaerolineales bacterium]|jgi:putative sterol carrier protein|nr:SCP2 sterol-binding domain-containing protein [Anaerolineales bacterium]
MAYPFPSEEWLLVLVEVLNSDPRYAEVAKKWEGDMTVVIEPEDGDERHDLPVAVYLDLWHGKCRSARFFDMEKEEMPDAAFTLRARIDNIEQLFKGKLDPIQAMMTRRLRVEGNMAYMLRNVPTVLDFVRCCQLVPIKD